MVQGTAETANRGVDVALQEVKTERLIEVLHHLPRGCRLNCGCSVCALTSSSTTTPNSRPSTSKTSRIHLLHSLPPVTRIRRLAADFAGKEADLDFFLYRTYGYHLDVSKRSAINMEANSDNNDVGAVVISRGFCAGDHRLNDRVLVENGKVSLQLTPRTHVDTAGRKFEQYYGYGEEKR
eukprot:747117-Hanusia_phi.AAC.13